MLSGVLVWASSHLLIFVLNPVPLTLIPDMGTMTDSSMEPLPSNASVRVETIATETSSIRGPQPGDRSRSGAPPERPKIKATTFPILREGSVQLTPRTADPTTPHGWNPPASEELARAPKKLKIASKAIRRDEGSWLATCRGPVQEDISVDILCAGETLDSPGGRNGGRRQ